jgi:hypothetical protein
MRNAKRKATREANKAEKAAKKARATPKRSTATPPPGTAPPEPTPPEPRLILVPDNPGDQRQYLGRDFDGDLVDDDHHTVVATWMRRDQEDDNYGYAAVLVLSLAERGCVPSDEELEHLRYALSQVEAMAADTAEVTT